MDQLLDLRQVRTFLEVARTRSFTRAAAQLYFAQSTITAQVQSLEKDLGLPLFNRLGRQVELTEAGRQFVAHAEKLICSAEQARLSNLQQCLWSAVGVGAAFVAFGFARGVVSYAALNLVAATLITAGNVAAMTIWQIAVPEELQGRVFSAMQLVADITTPLSFALAAPITDRVMPAVFPQLGGATMWGVPPTGEMAALFAVMGALMIGGFLLAAGVRDIRSLASRTGDDTDDDAAHQQA